MKQILVFLFQEKNIIGSISQKRLLLLINDLTHFLKVSTVINSGGDLNCDEGCAVGEDHAKNPTGDMNKEAVDLLFSCAIGAAWKSCESPDEEWASSDHAEINETEAHLSDDQKAIELVNGALSEFFFHETLVPKRCKEKS